MLTASEQKELFAYCTNPKITVHDFKRILPIAWKTYQSIGISKEVFAMDLKMPIDIIDRILRGEDVPLIDPSLPNLGLI